MKDLLKNRLFQLALVAFAVGFVPLYFLSLAATQLN
jgi:hypothetical protein